MVALLNPTPPTGLDPFPAASGDLGRDAQKSPDKRKVRAAAREARRLREGAIPPLPVPSTADREGRSRPEVPRDSAQRLHFSNRVQGPLNIDQYHELIRAGKLTEDDPVELLEGRLVTKMPKNPPHRLATGLLRQALEQVVPAGWYVDSQEPVTLSDSDSEPEPDVMVVRGERRRYTDHHPGPADLALVVEVSDTTLTNDRAAKKRSYARASIPIYWILNLHDRQLEDYSDPSGPTEQPDYRQSHIYRPEDRVPVVIGGDERSRLAVQDLLP